MGKDFYLKIADETLYRFLGEFDIYPITKNIHPDEVNEFIAKVKNISIGSTDFIVLRLRKTTNVPRTTVFDENYVIPEEQYVPVVIFIKKCHSDAKNSDFFNIEIYHIWYLHNCAKNLDNELDKYMAILNLSEDLYFEYSPDKKEVVLFKFEENEKRIKFTGSVESFVKKLNEQEYNVNPVTFDKLIFDIENLSNSFFHILKSDILSKDGSCERICIRGLTVNKNQNKKIVLGILKNSKFISQSDIDFLENQANIDSLTGLLNKKAITDTIKLKMKSNSVKTLSLIMMDVDYFKDINDNYGHMFGDEVLVTVSETLKTIVGNRGVVGRIGGDEFLIGIENLSTENELRSILRAIRSKIEWTYSGQIKITTSLGTATWPNDASDYETLLKLADKCLYIAKEKGRNRFIIYIKEKHGTLSSVDLSSKAISMKPKINITQKSEHICKIIETLSNYDNLNDTIINVADSLKYYYLFDKCMIFYGDNLEKIYSSNSTEDDLKIIDILDKYKDIFDYRNLLVVGNYLSTEIKNIDLYNFLHKTKNYSTIQYLIKEGPFIKGLIVITTYEHSNKWSEVDINYLAIIFKLISKTLIENSHKEADN